MKLFKITDHSTWPAYKITHFLTGKYLYGIHPNGAVYLWLKAPYSISDNILTLGDFEPIYNIKVSLEKNLEIFLTFPFEPIRNFAKNHPLGKFNEEKDLIPHFIQK